MPDYASEFPPSAEMSEDGQQWPEDGSPYWKAVREFTETAWEEAKADAGDASEAQKVATSIEYLMGKQWPAGRPRYKSRPVNNKIHRLWKEMVGLLTDIRPTDKVSANDHSDKDLAHQAEVLSKILRAWWLYADADLDVVGVVMYALTGVGYAKLEWNPRLRNNSGDFEILPLGNDHVLPLKPRPKGIQTAEAVIYQSVMPLSYFRDRYPLRGYMVRPDKAYSNPAAAITAPRNMSAGAFRYLSPAMQRVVGKSVQNDQSVFPMGLYREFWFRDNQRNQSNKTVLMGEYGTNWCYKVEPGKPLYPRGRLIVKGGDVVLHDGPNPWWHGRYPFADLRLNPVPWAYAGLSEIAPLLPLQDIYNNVMAGSLDMVKKAVNPGLIAPSNALSEEAWKQYDPSMPGAKLAYKPLSRERPTWQPAPQLPAWVLQIMQMAGREMESSSGMSLINEMARRKQVPAGDTFDVVRNSMNTPIRLMGRYIEVFLRDLGQLAIPSIMQWYSAGRRVAMLGLDSLSNADLDFDPGSMIPSGKTPEEHLKNFEYTIKPDSLLKINHQERLLGLMQLRKNHDISRRTLLEALDFGIDPDTEDRRLKEEAAQMPAPPPKGKK